MQPPFLREPTLASRIFEPIANFLTLQKATLHRDIYGARVTGYMVKRVVGLPGDTLRMAIYALSIRPRGGTDFIPEQQLVPVHYQILTADGPGMVERVSLFGELGGDRAQGRRVFRSRRQSSGFRLTAGRAGLVTRDRIVGKVVYRYWPPSRFGTP